jgi:hypothetical protein
MWIFHPWMPAGKAVAIGHEHFGDFDFQIWQRKNSDTFEPFATGLFACKQGGPWQVFLLDFQDIYHPRIKLSDGSSSVIVLDGGKELGIFDKATQTFKRASDGAVSPGATISGVPPGDWWQK